MGRFQQVIAATENDAYNALVCSDLGPELGVDRLAQTGHDEDRPSHVRARVLLPSGAPIDALQGRIDAGWTFRRTNTHAQFGSERKSGAEGKSVSVRVDASGRRNSK